MSGIRPAAADDLESLRAIERRAGERFREIGMAEIADDEPMPAEQLAVYADAGRAWVAVEDGAPIGYVIVDAVDGNAHVEQVTVDPQHQGKGVGRGLLDAVDGWARDRQMPALTLTTFSEVPWNAPLYRHLGFRELGEEEIGPELRQLRDAEAAYGLDPGLRVCMRRDIDR